jgi:hypothetical protein
MPEPSVEQQFAEALERDLFNRHGPMIGQEHLWQALGYSSIDAFRQAEARQTLPVRVFPLERRRGKFALVKDVALWLARQYTAQPAASVSELSD